MKKNILFISCEEAQHICDKMQYDEASIWERIKLTIRLSWCKITRAYTKRNRKLTDVIEHSDVKCLKTNERKVLKEQFHHELSNQKHH